MLLKIKWIHQIMEHTRWKNHCLFLIKLDITLLWTSFILTSMYTGSNYKRNLMLCIKTMQSHIYTYIKIDEFYTSQRKNKLVSSTTNYTNVRSWARSGNSTPFPLRSIIWCNKMEDENFFRGSAANIKTLIKLSNFITPVNDLHYLDFLIYICIFSYL